MKVRMLTSVAGTDKDGRSYVHEANEEYDLPAKLAKEYLSRPEDYPRAEPVAEKRVSRAERR